MLFQIRNPQPLLVLMLKENIGKQSGEIRLHKDHILECTKKRYSTPYQDGSSIRSLKSHTYQDTISEDIAQALMLCYQKSAPLGCEVSAHHFPTKTGSKPYLKKYHKRSNTKNHRAQTIFSRAIHQTKIQHCCTQNQLDTGI